MSAIPTTEKFKGHEPFKTLAPRVGVSVYRLYDDFHDGYLDALQGPHGLESTVELVYLAWQRRAADRRAKRTGASAGSSPPAAKATRKQRADRAAMAAFGCAAGMGEAK